MYNNFSCLDPNQYGFIPGSSTTLALISLIHRWTETVDERGGTVRALLRQRVKLHSDIHRRPI